MKISFVVSAFNRPQLLVCALASLQAQTFRDFEIILVDNGTTEVMQTSNHHAFKMTQTHDIKTTYIKTKGPTVYHSSEVGARLSFGDYIVFPSDDSYYVPKFAEKLAAKIDESNFDLIYWNMVFDDRCGFGRYEKIDVQPRVNQIDKTGFAIRREKMIAFPNKPDSDTPCSCDGMLIDALIASGVSHGKIDEVLAVHN